MAAPTEAERIRSRLSSLDRYRARFPGEPAPYFYTLTCGTRHLAYAGFVHGNAPAHPAFRQLEDFWERFLQATAGRSRHVLIEGGLRPVAASRDAAIQRDGEAGLAVWLAQGAGGLPVSSPEPDARRSFAALSAEFPRGAVCYAYAARRVPLWHRLDPRPPFDEFMQGAPVLVELPCDTSRGALAREHRRWVGGRFDVEDRDAFVRITDPAANRAITNRVLRRDTELRDIAVVSDILRRLRRGESLFVVYGVAHAVIEEPALTALGCEACAEPCRVEHAEAGPATGASSRPGAPAPAPRAP